MDLGPIVAIVGAVVGSQALVEFVKGHFSKKELSANAEKTGAEAAQILLDKTFEYVSKLTSRIEKLEVEIHELQTENASLREKIARLEGCRV